MAQDPAARETVIEFGGPVPVTVEGDGVSVTFSAEIAATPEQQQRGMMWREEMRDDQAMLFLYGAPQQINMWMRNTLISLDIVFIDEDGEIVKIIAGAQPLSRRLLRSDFPAVAVLEIRGGYALEAGIRPGHFVRHEAFGDPEG